MSSKQAEIRTNISSHLKDGQYVNLVDVAGKLIGEALVMMVDDEELNMDCLLYTSPSPRDRQKSRMPSSA